MGGGGEIFGRKKDLLDCQQMNITHIIPCDTTTKLVLLRATMRPYWPLLAQPLTFATNVTVLARWVRKAKDRDVSTGPLACPFARSPAPLTRLHSLHGSLRPRASLRSLTHFQDREKL